MARLQVKPGQRPLSRGAARPTAPPGEPRAPGGRSRRRAGEPSLPPSLAPGTLGTPGARPSHTSALAPLPRAGRGRRAGGGRGEGQGRRGRGKKVGVLEPSPPRPAFPSARSPPLPSPPFRMSGFFRLLSGLTSRPFLVPPPLRPPRGEGLRGRTVEARPCQWPPWNRSSLGPSTRGLGSKHAVPACWGRASPGSPGARRVPLGPAGRAKLAPRALRPGRPLAAGGPVAPRGWESLPRPCP